MPQPLQEFISNYSSESVSSLVEAMRFSSPSCITTEESEYYYDQYRELRRDSARYKATSLMLIMMEKFASPMSTTCLNSLEQSLVWSLNIKVD